MAIYFHGNFGLNRARMAELLRLALSDPSLRDKELAAQFGYGAPFSQRYRSWLNKTGMISLNFPLRLTPMGAVVWENDPELTTLTTQWFFHWELVTDPERSEVWHWFYYEFLPEHQTFTRDDLLTGLMMKLRGHSEKHFGMDSKLNPVIVRKLIDCYTTVEALGALQLVFEESSQYSTSQSLKTHGPWSNAAELDTVYVP